VGFFDWLALRLVALGLVGVMVEFLRTREFFDLRGEDRSFIDDNITLFSLDFSGICSSGSFIDPLMIFFGEVTLLLLSTNSSIRVTDLDLTNLVSP
jgi:hypothetical protein